MPHGAPHCPTVLGIEQLWKNNNTSKSLFVSLRRRLFSPRSLAVIKGLFCCR